MVTKGKIMKSMDDWLNERLCNQSAENIFSRIMLVTPVTETCEFKSKHHPGQCKGLEHSRNISIPEVTWD